MKLIVRGVCLPLDYTQELLTDTVRRKLGVSIRGVRVLRRAVDARKKNDVHFVFHIEADTERPLRRLPTDVFPAPDVVCAPENPVYPSLRRPLVVGAGPAGLFAALTLARAGANPLVCERGRSVEQRERDIHAFFAGGELDECSNVQFGEGGAGTFSDGKLATGISDPRCTQVLRDFAAAGAPEDILRDAKPHIGTDRLPGVVARLRQEIIALGGTFLYETQLVDILTKNGQIIGAMLAHDGTQTALSTPYILLAPGHSARDTFEMLLTRGVSLIQKPFSVGARIEHLQSRIDESQYGRFAGHPALGAADYKLSERMADGRGVYTFCMCPGGTVVAAASERGGICTNGMSVYARDGQNANAAVLVGITPEDFPSAHPLAGVMLQREIERAAYALTGSYRAPAQRLGDFLEGRPSTRFGTVHPSYLPGVIPADLEKVLPPPITDAMKSGLCAFDRRLHGFADADAVLTGPETRSSSPVRILRGEDCASITYRGLYPCGEGAGYAGGILSAAVDGIRCAEAILRDAVSLKN